MLITKKKTTVIIQKEFRLPLELDSPRVCSLGGTIGVLSVHSRVSLAPDTTAIDRNIGYSKSLMALDQT